MTQHLSILNTKHALVGLELFGGLYQMTMIDARLAPSRVALITVLTELQGMLSELVLPACP